MGFTRFVEVGRVVVINYGPEAGKLATVVNMIDTKRVLIDGPQKHTGVRRQILNLKRMALTDIVVEGLERDADAKTLTAAFEAQDIMGKWTATTWAKKIKARKVIFQHTRMAQRHTWMGRSNRTGWRLGSDCARAAVPSLASMLLLLPLPMLLLIPPLLPSTSCTTSRTNSLHLASSHHHTSSTGEGIHIGLR